MTATHRNPDRLWIALTALAVALVALVAGHDIDHVVEENRLVDLPALFWVLLPFQYAVLLGCLALVFRRDRLAPPAMAALSAVTLVAFVGAHLIPGGPGPYSEYDLSWVSWTLVGLPMAVAVACLAVALRLRAVGGDRPAPAEPAMGAEA